MLFQQKKSQPKTGWEAELLSHHEILHVLCNRLEGLADALPYDYSRQDCLAISWVIYPVVKAAHEFEETHIFPQLNNPDLNYPDISKSIERLKFEHWEDESFAEEISSILRELVSNSANANIEKIAYMLRGFFEGLRRHIAFEAEHLLPMLETTR